MQVRQYLDELHNKRMSPYEKIELLEAIRAQVGRVMSNAPRRDGECDDERAASW